RNRLGCALHSSDGRVREGDDDIDILRDELLGQRRRALVAALGPNEQESNVTSVFPADCPHIAPERFDELIDVLRSRPQYPDHRRAALLRARRERPCCGASAEQRDEFTTFHCPMPPVLPTERIAHLGTADRCIHPPGGTR